VLSAPRAFPSFPFIPEQARRPLHSPPATTPAPTPTIPTSALSRPTGTAASIR